MHDQTIVPLPMQPWKSIAIGCVWYGLVSCAVILMFGSIGWVPIVGMTACALMLLSALFPDYRTTAAGVVTYWALPIAIVAAILLWTKFVTLHDFPRLLVQYALPALLMLSAVSLPWALICTAVFRRYDQARKSNSPSRTCITCGYSLRGLPHRRCPECGVVNAACGESQEVS